MNERWFLSLLIDISQRTREIYPPAVAPKSVALHVQDKRGQVWGGKDIEKGVGAWFYPA